MGVAELEEVGHCDNLAQLVVQELIERNEQPAEEQNHPALHLPVCHTYTVFSSGAGETYEVLRSDIGCEDCHTDYIPRFALAEEVVRRAFALRRFLVLNDGVPYSPYHSEETYNEYSPVEPYKFM